MSLDKTKFLANLRAKNITRPSLRSLIELTKAFDTERMVLRFTTHFVERANDKRNHPDVTYTEIHTAFMKLKEQYDFVMRREPNERFIMRLANNLFIMCVVTFDDTNVRIRAVSCIRKKQYFSELKQLDIETGDVFKVEFRKPKKYYDKTEPLTDDE